MHNLMRMLLIALVALACMSCGEKMDDRIKQGQGAAGNPEEMADSTRLDAASPDDAGNALETADRQPDSM